MAHVTNNDAAHRILVALRYLILLRNAEPGLPTAASVALRGAIGELVEEFLRVDELNPRGPYYDAEKNVMHMSNSAKRLWRRRETLEDNFDEVDALMDSLNAVLALEG